MRREPDPILDYRAARSAPPPRLDEWSSTTVATAAFILCAPGVLCWALFLFPYPRAVPSAVQDAALPCLLVAVATALISVVYAAGAVILHRRLHWAFVVNLCINVPGLAFAVIAVALAL